MYTWADLDNANKRDGTYNRRRCLLAQARKRLDDLEKREIEIIDAYEDGLMPFSEVKNIQREIMHAQRDYDRLRDLYNAVGMVLKECAEVQKVLTEVSVKYLVCI